MFLNRSLSSKNLLRSRIKFILLWRLNSLFLLFFFISLSRCLQSFVVFWIKCYHSNYNCFASFILLWIISIKMFWLITFKTTIIFFIFHFIIRVFVARLRVEIIIWFIILFKFIWMTSFVRLMILIKLIIEEFVIFILIMTAVVIFARATRNNFLHNDFEQYNFFNVWHISHNKKLVFQYWNKLNQK